MTFAIGYVQGGSGAGRKRPLREKPKGWHCQCLDTTPGPSVHVFSVSGMEIVSWRREQPGYLTACPDCGARRDG